MRFLHFDVLDSTNAKAKQLAKNGIFEPLWIYADTQTKGRGRRGREWVSQKENLFCTGLYPSGNDVRANARFSFVAALALAETLDQFIDNEKVKIKWPNDVQAGGEKIAGILLETGSDNGQSWIAIGIGMNIVSSPSIENYQTTHLLAHIIDSEKAVTAKAVTAKAVLKILTDRFEHWRSLYLRDGFLPIKTAWLERACGIGGAVKVNLQKTTFDGIAVGLDDDGALEVKKENGETVKIHAGDVFFS